VHASFHSMHCCALRCKTFFEPPIPLKLRELIVNLSVDPGESARAISPKWYTRHPKGADVKTFHVFLKGQAEPVPIKAEKVEKKAPVATPGTRFWRLSQRT